MAKAHASSWEVTDAFWQRVEPLVPKPPKSPKVPEPPPNWSPPPAVGLAGCVASLPSAVSVPRSSAPRSSAPPSAS